MGRIRGPGSQEKMDTRHEERPVLGDEGGSDWRKGKIKVLQAVAALSVAVLVDQGHLSYEDKVVDYWPEYGQHGKENTTVEHVMTHMVGHNICFSFDHPLLPETGTLPGLFLEAPPCLLFRARHVGWHNRACFYTDDSGGHPISPRRGRDPPPDKLLGTGEDHRKQQAPVDTR